MGGDSEVADLAFMETILNWLGSVWTEGILGENRNVIHELKDSCVWEWLEWECDY